MNTELGRMALHALLYVGIVFICVGLFIAYMERKGQPKRDPYEEPEAETEEEKADRNFFKYIDKINKDTNRI